MAEELLDSGFAVDLVARVEAAGFDFVEVYAERRTEVVVHRGDRAVEGARVDVDAGVSLRAVRGSTSYFDLVESLDPAELVRLGADLVPGASPPGPRSAPAAAERARAFVPSSVRDLLETAAESAARPAVVQREATYMARSSAIAVFNNLGARAADSRRRAALFVLAVASVDDETAVTNLVRALDGDASSDVERAAATGEAAGRAAETAARAPRGPSGPMPVVLASGLGGVLLHEALGHALEADEVHKDASVYARRLGERLADAQVTVVDDGGVPDAWGSVGVDDEGTPPERTAVLADGVLTGYLYDLLEARRADVLPTGNGRRESFRSPPMPRMTNTFVAPGQATTADLIGSVTRGLYVTGLGGGQVDPISGNFAFHATEAFAVERGEVKGPVRAGVLVGNALDVLASIDGVADDLRIEPALCNKASQSIPVGVGQPHLLVRRLTVGRSE
jgi:TldD protein